MNTSFSIDSNLNSISSLYNNMNSNNKNISSFSSTVSNNLYMSFINLEVLYALEEKLKVIVGKVNNYQKCSKECFEFINCYFIHHFYNEELRLFRPGLNRKNINNYIKNELLCYFLCFDISFSEDFKHAEILLKRIFSLLYKNFLSLIFLIISNYKNKKSNIIMLLNKIIKDNLYDDDLNEDNINYNNLDENKFIDIIEFNSKKLIDYNKMVIENIYMKYIKEKINQI